MKKEIVKLRPHHVEQLIFEPLIVLEWLRAGKYPGTAEEVTREELEELIAKLDKNDPLEKIMKEVLTKIPVGYKGTEFRENLKKLHAKLIKNPRILIVSGIDDICKSCGMRKIPFCQKNEGDQRIARYGLKIGGIYSMQEILQKLSVEKKQIKKYFSWKNKLQKLLKT